MSGNVQSRVSKFSAFTEALRFVSGSVRRAYGAGLQAFVLLQVHL